MIPRLRAAPIAALAAVLLLALPARSEAVAETLAGASNVPLFSISKTENRNYVQFAERLDARCAPIGSAPVFAYWKMIEHGPSAVEPLLALEQPAYGVASQSPLERGEGHGLVSVTLRALSRSPLLVESRRNGSGVCEASAKTPIGGVEARLFNVHAILRWPFGVARLLVSGSSIADGRPVRETRTP